MDLAGEGRQGEDYSDPRREAMRVAASITAIAIAFTIGLTIRPAPETIHQVETVIVTETVIDTIVELVDRDVRAPETDETILYTCWMQLVDAASITDWAVEIAYIARKWAGDTCQALDHHLAHGRY
jgi:hypothetical protein